MKLGLHITLSDIEIPRKLGVSVFSIHTFCDASKSAYTAVIFYGSKVKMELLKLLASKSRIVPENVSIPRLELLAASIGSRLTNEVVNALGYTAVPTSYWSDSTTALTWIERDTQWGVFVWNRVREIRRLTAAGVWRFVPGDLNPADLPSRGCTSKQL